MEEKHVNSWVEFKKTVDEIRKKYGHSEYATSGGQTITEKKAVLFRGQQNATWSLETTLERATRETYSVERYIRRATRLSNILEAYTDRKWSIPEIPRIDQQIADKQHSSRVYLPYYNFLVYLRHHGYPSPLLDWSESPYIAAYFAMSKPSSSERVAVFVYIESTTSGKEAWNNPPRINLHGPFANTDKRHFMQQAWYTTATNWSEEKKRHTFCSHHAIFDNTNLPNTQDILVKITIPSSERIVVLQDLYDYNINHFTLFNTEDALIKTLSIKNFDLGEWL